MGGRPVKRLATLALIILVSTLTLAKPSKDIYYRFLAFYPTQLVFKANTDQMACGALYDPAPQNPPQNYSQVSYTSLNLPGLSTCTNPYPYANPQGSGANPQGSGDPVVVLPQRPNQPVYGWILVVEFWGQGSTSPPDPGTHGLEQALRQQRISFKATAQNRKSIKTPDLQVSDALYSPTVSLSSITWQKWNGSVRSTGGGYTATFTTHMSKPMWQSCSISGASWCHRAYWALPFHLRIHGYERSTRRKPLKASVAPGEIQPGKGSLTQGGQLVRIKFVQRNTPYRPHPPVNRNLRVTLTP